MGWKKGLVPPVDFSTRDLRKKFADAALGGHHAMIALEKSGDAEWQQAAVIAKLKLLLDEIAIGEISVQGHLQTAVFDNVLATRDGAIRRLEKIAESDSTSSHAAHAALEFIRLRRSC